MSSVCVIGLGSIGLPTSVTLASVGHRVVGVDVNGDLVDRLNGSETDSSEPGLADLLADVIASGQFRAEVNTPPSEYFIVSVPTPIDADGLPNLSFVIAAAESAGRVLRAGDVVILESTVPPGTTSGVFCDALEQASGLRAGEDFSLAHCPERVLPGKILEEITSNPRLIGGFDSHSIFKTQELYSTFVSGELIASTPVDAEFTKLAENSYRDVNIALANELALVAESVGSEISEVIPMANMHPRVSILNPGVGVGGYCIPIASNFISVNSSADTQVMPAARAVNDSMPELIARRALDGVAGVVNPVIAVLGVSYKPDVGDTRATPASEVIDFLKTEGVDVRVHDPHVGTFVPTPIDLDTAVDGADLVLVLTGHSEFATLNPAQLGESMKGRSAFDGTGVLDADEWRAAGFQFRALGSNRPISGSSV